MLFLLVVVFLGKSGFKHEFGYGCLLTMVFVSGSGNTYVRNSWRVHRQMQAVFCKFQIDVQMILQKLETGFSGHLGFQ